MRKALGGVCTLFAVLVSATFVESALTFEVQAGGDNLLFESEGMRGLPPEFRSVAIRNVTGAGAPWVINRGEVKIEMEDESLARVRVEVRGLVLDPAFEPPPRGGTNPVADFIAIVSCIDGVDAMGEPTFTNVVSEPFPADEQGNAELDTMLLLPDPCLGIIVFVTSPTQRWFAITGF